MANPENLANYLLPQVNHNPDVLSCLANLSNDEVFTPPNVANAMLDMLPRELFSNPDAKFLDPVCKSGVFLREITKRLMQGLEKNFPDKQERLDHILHNQVYGIAITELTSLLSRRTLYCAKYPNCPYSISKFDNITGNIRYKAIQHTWKNGRCIFCGASQSQYEREEGLETHAYEFIHIDNPQEIFGDMKFDVIIGNPPYQLSDGGYGISAMPIYDNFIIKAISINPKYITMIVPARWFAGGKGLDEFRKAMLHDNRIREIHDYPEAFECFPGVQIKGGVCYFLWDSNHAGDCKVITHKNGKVGKPLKRPLLENGCDTFIRYNEAIGILHKIKKFDENSFENLVSARQPFGLPTNFHGSKTGEIKIYENSGISYIDLKDIKKNKPIINKYKIFLPRAGSGSDAFPHQIIGKPILGEPFTACSETYIYIGPFKNKNQTINVISYVSTKFFRFIAMLKKVTQSTTRSIYTLVPIQDFSKPWTDAELYAKYNLSQEEIDFIESMIKPMDLSPETDTEPQNA